MDQTLRQALALRGGGVPTLNVPVVVHIVHDNGDENISDAQVLQGIEDLNDAFANAGPYLQAEGTDAHIHFCLAQTDPDQQPSTGITRTQHPLTVLEMETQDAGLKLMIQWPAVSYLNIWVVRAINSVSYGASVAGYATLPYQHGWQTDGIVVEAQWFGSSPDQSKILIHEAGHYLGLYHTFEGGCANNDCSMEGDQVCDTPPDQSIAPVCLPTTNSCTSDSDDPTAQNPFRAIDLGGLGDVPDLFESYMDYGSYVCLDRFSAGQCDRMYTALSSLRESLLLNDFCPPPCGISSVIAIEPPTGAVLVGVPVQFGNNSSSLSPYTFEWYVDGAFAGTDTVLDQTFITTGAHTVELQMLITDGTCSLIDEFTIEVVCDAQAEFAFAPAHPDVGESTVFTCTTPLAQGVQWFINGLLAGTGNPWSQSFADAGGNSVSVVVTGTSCTDTSQVAFVPVGVCTTGQNNHFVLAGGDIVSFNTGAPVSQVQSADPPFGAYEGLSCISDANGNLVLYCDANTVFNGAHEPIVGGMNGGISSSQAALILPHPGNEQLYYVITTDDVGGSHGGQMQYALIDMSMNGGAGGALGTNQMLMSQSSEKLTATALCDGSGYWVIGQTLLGQEYHAFRLDASGLNTTPVISPSGTFLNWGALGCMRASPKGDFIASAYYHNETGVQLRRFDNSTGVVSGFTDLGTIGNTGQYGVEFSADGSKLYAANLDEFNYSLHTIHQWDLTSGIPTLVINSATQVASGSGSGTMGSIQHGPDGRIYVLRDGKPWFDAIADPNEAGLACNYIEAAVQLNTVTFGYGISNLAPSLGAASAPSIYGPTQVCADAGITAYTLSCTNSAPVWTHAGPNELVTSTASSATINFTQTGTDTLIAIFGSGCAVADTLIIHSGSTVVDLGTDTLVCSPANFILDAGPGALGYQWQNGSGSRYFPVTSPGTYSVTVYGVGGCPAFDEITISTFDSPWSFSLGPDILQCQGAAVLVNAPTGNFSAYHWSNGSTEESTGINPGAILILTLYDQLGCAASDTIQSFVATNTDPTILGDSTLCPGQVTVLTTNAPLPGQQFWNNSSLEAPALAVYTPGTYWVTVYACGFPGATDSIAIVAADAPDIDLGPDTMQCPWQPILLSSAYVADTYYWSDGSSASTLLADMAGTYWLTVQDSEGCYATDSVTVSFCTAIDDLTTASAVLVPNPSNGNLVLQLPADLNGAIGNIFDARGRVVRRLTGLGSGTNALDLSDVADGLYTLSLRAGARDETIRFSIQRK